MLLPFSTLDLIALSCFAILLAGYEAMARFGPLARRSLSAAMQMQRRQWIERMRVRDQRHFDAILLASLSQSNAFFASTSVLGIGGLAAILGSGDRAQVMLEKLPFVARSSPALWEMKILLLMAILVYAFFKFAWAFRLSHYTAIMFGGMPGGDAEDSEKLAAHAEQTAHLLGLVGEHANSGLRSFYYAFSIIAWFFHPLLFIAAAAGVVMILLRREHLSRAAAIVRRANSLGRSDA
ncbi:MAG: DUF599 domain-containing protein [Hyphomicrobiaceae bacterium]|nr:DUF599 domain-containing protein [Hyphomicrobiaceae bacterium]